MVVATIAPSLGSAGIAARRAADALPDTEEALDISVSCVGRRLVLGERTEEDVETVLDSAPARSAHVGLRQIRDWRAGSAAPPPVAVNLSARQFASESLVDDIVAALKTYGVAPGDIEVELTESALMAEPERANEVLTQLSRSAPAWLQGDIGRTWRSHPQRTADGRGATEVNFASSGRSCCKSTHKSSSSPRWNFGTREARVDTSMQMRKWAAMAALAILSACGGGGGGGGEETPVLQGNFFPLAVGDRWVYDDGGSSAMAVRATGTRRVDGLDGIVMLTEDPVAGSSESVYIVSATGVRQVSTDRSDPLTNAIGPLDVLRFPLHAGDSFTQIDRTIATGMDFDGDGRQESAAVRSDVRVVGLESITTPLATYANALHVHTTLTVAVQLSATAQAVTVTTAVDDWYAPDIGPVRSVIVTNSQGVSETRTFGVVGWQVGARRSETTPPEVRTLQPAANGVMGPNGQIGVTFSEPMDAAALATAITLTGPAGQAVSVTVQATRSGATLVPALGLVSGIYEARISTAAIDLAGNPLAEAFGWRFEIDATGPVLAESTPAADATDVALDSAIVLRFNEPIDPASVGAGGVRLSTVGVGSMGSEVPITTAVNGSTLTVTPTAPLARAQLYELHIYDNAGPADLLGNRMPTDVLLRFRADTGRFAAPVALAAEGVVDAVAVADVNGDGRADMLFTTGYTAPSGQMFKLGLRLQQADGSLGAAQMLDTRAEYVCPASSIAIGDLDGDGRNDLVLGARGCGLQIFRQGSDGVLRAAEFIDTVQSGRIRLADMNRDGRLDIVAAGGYGTALAVWLQAADGSMVLHATPAFEYYGPDLDIGDVNGDGLLDIVVSSNSGDPDRSIGIILQNPDGSFAPALARSTGTFGGVAALAVGDISGDGRDDIVVVYGGNSGRLGVILQQAGGSLGSLTAIPSYDSPNQVEIADVNGDGRRDVVVGHSGWYAVGVYMQQPNGTLADEARYPANYGNNNPGSMAVGDLTGDGRVDVVVAEAMLRQRVVDVGALAVPRPGLAQTLKRMVRSAAGR